MSDLNLTVNEGSGVYLAITETPAVVTLGAAVISGALSSTVTVANTVTVALDANSLSALENVTVTVGAAVSISNFPSSQVVSVSNFPNSSSVTIANFPSVTTVTGTVALDSASLLALENITVTVGSSVALAAGSAQIGSVTVANFPATQTVQGTVTVGSLPLVSGSVTVNNFPSTQTVQGTVTANTGLSQPLTDTQLRASSVTVGIASLPASTVTVSSLPSISGTVTAVLSANTNFNDGGDRLNVGLGAVAGIDPANWLKVDGGSVPVSGTVTANVPAATSIDNQLPYLYGNNTDDPKQTAVPIGFNDTNDDKFYNVSDVHPLPISGAVTANAFGTDTSGNSVRIPVAESHCGNTSNWGVPIAWNDFNDGPDIRVVGDAYPLPVKVLSGVTANLSKPTWTDYSGTITQAGTAVTAISTTERSYLLAQVTTGQMFLNIGATCTTGNGVYFSAGQGFAWETSVPQGIVSIISSVTGTNYVLKDG